MNETSPLMAGIINENRFRRQPIRVDQLPPGYRFLPTDQELVVHYLHNKVMNRPLPTHFISDVDIYKLNPEALSTDYPTYLRGEGWYFFTPREKKYPNGSRPNRSADNGYWKATGADKDIKDENNKVVGRKQSLVFYKGRASSGIKTNWIMYEYKVPAQPDRPRPAADPNNRMRLDDWVLCRIKRERRVVAPSNTTAEDGTSPDTGSEPPAAAGAEEIDVPGLEPDRAGQDMVLAESIDGFEMQGFIDTYMNDFGLSSGSEPAGADVRNILAGPITPEGSNILVGSVTPLEERSVSLSIQDVLCFFNDDESSEQLGLITNGDFQ